MRMNPIITSLLSTDLYKLSMQQLFLHQQSGRWGRYVFKCRNEGIVWTPEMLQEIQEQVEHLCTLRYTYDELNYLSKIRFLDRGFIEFLRLFQLNTNHVNVFVDGNNGLHIMAKGPIYLVSPFEIYVLAIVNEVYFHFSTNPLPDSGLMAKAEYNLQKKIEFLNSHPMRITDFGTRRRFSGEWHKHVVQEFYTKCDPSLFAGTSNVYLAKQFKITPVGTMAHEFLMLYQALNGVSLVESQKMALQAWVNEYRGNLGIALTDTLGMDKFLKDFDLYFAKLYDGVRHDSGDPFVWTDKMLDHYRTLGINPQTKQLIYSNGLSLPKAWEIQRKYEGEAMLSYGVGTNLTNDMGPRVVPLQIVMKLVEIDDKPVAKLSDDPGKSMCEDADFETYLRNVCRSDK